MKTPNVQLLRDLVLIRAMSLELNKSAGGVIIPGDLDKMAPKRALVVATGPGTYNKKGEFVEAPCKAGDVILYMERDLIPVKLEGEDFYIVPASEVLLKLAAAPVDNEALRLAIEAKFIAKMEALGLTRLEDISGPVEIFKTGDGAEVVASARSFIVSDASLDDPYTPPDGTVAFSMWQVTQRVAGVHTGDFVVRVAFLDKVGERVKD